MEYQKTLKKMNGISTLYSPLKRDPFWKREWMCLISLYFLKKILKSKNFKQLGKNKSFYRKRNIDFLNFNCFLKFKIILFFILKPEI